MTEERLNKKFLEKLITKGILTDKTFLVLVSNAFISDYFDNHAIGKIFNLTKNHLDQHNQIPSKDVIVNTLNDEDVNNTLRDVNEIEFDIAQSYDYLIDQTNMYLKDKAIKKAMMDSMEVIKKSDDPELIRQNFENALCKDLKVDIGLAYFKELGERLRKIFTTTDVRIPTYYPNFDDIITGGFPPLTLSVIVAKIHGFKSNTMANFAARQVLHGHIPVILTLEMSEMMFAQRFDSIYSKMDINRMYHGKTNKMELSKRLVKVKRTEGRGELYIKQYPTGAASVRDFRIYIRELKLRDINPDIVYVDYINLMKSAYKQTNDLYTSVKSVSEELRALSFEFQLPVVSVSQLNREGTFTGFSDVGYNYISESLGVPATADFMSIFGIDEDLLVYENELHNKIVKNRFGRLNEVWVSYYDDKSLKMYDETEEQVWIEDAKAAGDERRIKTDKKINDE